MKEYSVVSNDWNLDLGIVPLEECVLFESNDLEECKNYVNEMFNLTESNIVVSSTGRIAIGDWYGAYDDDIGWEYD